MRATTRQSGVTICAFRNGDDELSVEYIGLPDQVVALGYPTAEMVAPGKKGLKRHDLEGRRFLRCKFPNGRVSIRVMCQVMDALTHLPGAFTALDKQADYEPEIEHVDVGPLLQPFRRGTAA
jgi:hypothetical protein